MARVTTRIELDQEAQSELLSVLGRLPAVRAETIVRSSGVGESEIHADAAQLRSRLEDPQVASGSSGEFRGLHGAVVFQAETGALAGRLTSPGVLLEGPETTLSLAGFELLFDTQLGTSGVRVGTVEPRVARLRIGPTRADGTPPPVVSAEVSEGGEAGSADGATEDADAARSPDLAGAAAPPLEGLELSDLRASQQLRVSSGELQATYVLALETLAANGKSHGPAAFEVAIRDVDVATVRESGSGPASLLRSGRPLLDLRRFELATDEGLVRAKGHLRLTGGWPDGSAATPLLALLGLEAVLELEGPAALLESVWPGEASALRELEASGAVAREGDMARARFELTGGVLTANGRPLDPGLFPASLGELAEARGQGLRP